MPRLMAVQGARGPSGLPGKEGHRQSHHGGEGPADTPPQGSWPWGRVECTRWTTWAVKMKHSVPEAVTQGGSGERTEKGGTEGMRGEREGQNEEALCV